jgi:hypothetical protein
MVLSILISSERPAKTPLLTRGLLPLCMLPLGSPENIVSKVLSHGLNLINPLGLTVELH